MAIGPLNWERLPSSPYAGPTIVTYALGPMFALGTYWPCWNKPRWSFRWQLIANRYAVSSRRACNKSLRFAAVWEKRILNKGGGKECFEQGQVDLNDPGFFIIVPKEKPKTMTEQLLSGTARVDKQIDEEDSVPTISCQSPHE